MLNLFDSHSHSDHSPDGNHSVTFMCEKALAGGLMGLCVTDHCEIESYRQEGFALRMRQSVFSIQKARAAFGGRLLLTAGIELGQPLAGPETAARALAQADYDFVLGSVHLPRGGQDYYFGDYHGYTEKQTRELLAQYFQEVLETARWGQFDVLAHLTYPLRYIEGRDGAPCDLAAHQETIDAILRTLVEKGKGLELNVRNLYREDTSGYRVPCPPADILRRYRELGGEIVTLGSDAHVAEYIGAGVEEGMRLLLDCGFRYFAFYKERRPRMLAIE